MDDYKIIINYSNDGDTLEEIILNNFKFYLDINSDFYE